MDLLGHLLRATPQFRGKGRLVEHWLRHPGTPRQRRRLLPGQLFIECDLGVPYEAMVWLEAEEEQDLQTLRQLLKPGERFIDCGANIGLWTLVAASAVGPAGCVVAIEPNPATFQKLQHNVSLNRLTTVKPFAVAAGETRGTLPFHCEREHNISRMAEDAEQSSMNIQVEPLDGLIDDGPVHGVKIDVEGFELPVLKGAGSILGKCRPWVCVEFNAVIARNRRLGDWPVHQHLTRAGYVARHFSQAFQPPQVQLSEAWECPAYANLLYQKL